MTSKLILPLGVTARGADELRIGGSPASRMPLPFKSL